MKKQLSVVGIIAALLFALVFVVTTDAGILKKKVKFESPLYGPQVNPSEPAYCVGCGGLVSVYDLQGITYIDFYFKSTPNVTFHLIMELGGCTVDYCFGPGSNFWREGFLIDEVTTDSAGEYLGTYALRDFLPPHMPVAESPTFRAEPIDNAPFVFFSGFDVLPPPPPPTP